jgi:hypothetical protein
MMNSKFHTIGWLALACLFAAGRPATAATILDAHWDGPADDSGGYLAHLGIDIGQTFTVENAGTLSSVSFVAGATADFAGPLVMDIRPVTGGFPTALASTALFSTTLTAGQIPSGVFGNVTVDVSSAGIGVTPGEMLAITLSSNAATGGARWAFTTGDPYAGGASYFRGHGDGIPFLLGGADQLFDTVVQTAPEPASYLFAASGLLLAAAVGRRKSIRK